MVDLEILFHDVKDHAIIKIIDALEVAVLLPPVDFPHAPCDNDTIKTALVILWVLLPNLLAGVKEADLSRAKSANAGMVGSLGHGGIVVLPKTQYDTYKFLFRKQRLATTTLF